MNAAAVVAFQSPPHRGRFCDYPDPVHPPADRSFQSPPHRGRFCDHVRDPRAGAGLLLSVPSSSGKILRLDTLPTIGYDQTIFQSPPHRGRFCDGRPPLGRPDSGPFQSPPHRGRFCDDLGPLLDRVDPRFFQSPPHRGRFCDGEPGVAERLVERVLSVPSSSGKILRRQRARERRVEECTFSPLLIGEDSATGRAGSRQPR